jgi:hypothetical protein
MLPKKIVISFLLVLSLLVWSSPVLAAAPVDSDKDSLTDDLEAKFKTDSQNPDSDADGFKDGEEVDWAYNPLSTSTVRLARRVEVDLKKQRLSYFVNNIKWREFIVSTGKRSTPTPKGEFKVQNKITKAWSKTFKLWMPYWLGLGGGIGIHELPIWPNGYREGENHLGTPVSHGCIRLGLKNAAYLFDRIDPGVIVKIY